VRIAAAQARPVWLDAQATTARVIATLQEAASQDVEVVAFSETFLCGYPFWVCRTNGAAFDDPLQKECYARYLEAAVEADGPEVRAIREAAGDLGILVFLGMTERGVKVASGTTWCSVAAIDPEQGVVGVHRKLVPTHDERLVWGRGDGHGLRTHEFRGVRFGALSCWENWMPQARHALYADGADVHIAVWPGWSGLVGDITRFIAMEGRVYSLAASGLLSWEDVPADFPMVEEMRSAYPDLPFDGGSAIAGPDGAWIVEPVRDEERLVIAEVDVHQVRRERLMFDAAGHYARPDVFRTTVSRVRQEAAVFEDA
jgi:nitrilase